MLLYMCAKFGACITKCTILLNIWAKPPHYIGSLAIRIFRKAEFCWQL